MIINENTGVFYFLMKREFIWKDFEILKIFEIKNMILFRLNSCVYKIFSKTFIKGSRIESIEDNKKQYKKFLEEFWKKTNILREIFKNQLKWGLN